MVCQVCGAKSGIHPLCLPDFTRYKKGDVVKCAGCGMMRLKDGDCPRCTRSLSSDLIPINRGEVEYWGKKLFAIAKTGKEWSREKPDLDRYERTMAVSSELMPLWRDPETTTTVMPRNSIGSWSDVLRSVADTGLMQSEDSHDISRYADILRIADEMQQESASYYSNPDLTMTGESTPSDVEFIADREIPPKLIAMIEKAEKVVLIASPWVREIGEIVEELEEVARTRHVRVSIIVRPPEKGKENSHRETVRDLYKRHFQIETERVLHAKMVLVDDKELYIGSANLTGTSMGRNLEVGICTSNPDVVSKAALYFEQVIQKAFDRRLDSKS